MRRERTATGRYVTTVSAAAVAMVIAVVGSSSIGDPWLVAGFAVALAAAQLLPIPIRRGTEVEMVGFEEAMMLPMLLALPLGGQLLSMVGALVAWQFVSRQPLEKACFNAAQMLLSLGAAGTVVQLLAGSAPGATSDAFVAAMGGLAVLFAVNQLLVAGVLSRALDAPFIATLRGDFPTKLVMWVVNLAFGALLVPAFFDRPATLVGAAVLFAFMYASARAFLRDAHGDDAIAGLVDATERLGDDMPVVSVAAHVARVACEVDGACGAMVRLIPDELGEAGALLLAECGGDAGDLAFQEGVRGRLAAVLPLEAGGMRIGELRVWRDPTQVTRSRPQRRRDRAMLEVVARNASVALAKALVMQVSTQQLHTMAQVFEHANECLVVLDGDGRVTASNPAMSALVGIPAEDLVGRDVASFSQDLAHFVEVGDGCIADARLLTRSGDVRVVRASVAPVDVDGSRRRRTWVLARIMAGMTQHHA